MLMMSVSIFLNCQFYNVGQEEGRLNGRYVIKVSVDTLRWCPGSRIGKRKIDGRTNGRFCIHNQNQSKFGSKILHLPF